MRADLIERGRSLHELGHTFTWSDLRAFIAFLPPTSHFRREEDPEQARRVEWAQRLSDPQIILLGDLFDLMQADMFIRAGESPPGQTSRQRLFEQLVSQDHSRGGRESHSSQQSHQEASPRPRKTPADIRAQIKNAERQ